MAQYLKAIQRSKNKDRILLAAGPIPQLRKKVESGNLL
jgi:hypothetical protein